MSQCMFLAGLGTNSAALLGMLVVPLSTLRMAQTMSTIRLYPVSISPP